MNRSRIFLPALLLTLTLASGPAAAQLASCLDQAKSSTELDQCGGPLVAHLDETIESEFKRISEKYIGNEKMQEMLKNTKRSWNDYRNNRCLLEATMASGGTTIKPFALETNKVYFKCIFRKLDEMKNSLEKF